MNIEKIEKNGTICAVVRSELLFTGWGNKA